MRTLEDYKDIVGVDIIGEIHRKVRPLYGKRIVHINSTSMGGGVAEILQSLVPLMNDIGLVAGWRTLHGNPDFFDITKKFHNALQGEAIHFTKTKERIYIQTNVNFSSYTHFDHDLVIIHDPQPLPLVKLYKKTAPWAWRCHVDLSNPNREVWDFFLNFILRYDMVILSNNDYKRPDLPVEQKIIYPAIDPLTTKNMDISESDVAKYLKKFGIKTDKPIIAQISRFDKWKDPEGVLDVFRLVREVVDCRLVLCGSVAADDPEGTMIFERIEKKAADLIKNEDVVLVISENNMLVNALQRKASVIIQKSIKEGFCLAVTEALWKGTPVVASRVGGIPLQIEHGVNGCLVDPLDNEGFAREIVEVLKEPEKKRGLGLKGKETVREKFLITRHLSDYLDMISYLLIS
jgi:trehalose synthase